MDKARLNRLARALHEAMVHSPAFPFARGQYEEMLPERQSEYRAVCHSVLRAAGIQQVWVLTDESDRPPEDAYLSSVVGVYESFEALLEDVPKSHGGAEDLEWTEQNDGRRTAQYGEYPWVAQRFYVGLDNPLTRSP